MSQSRIVSLAAACALAAAAVPAPPAAAAESAPVDASSEAASSLSSFGSSAAAVGLRAGSSLPDLSSEKPAAAEGDAPGEIGGTTRVPGSTGKRISYTSTNEAGEVVSVTGALYDTKNAKGLIALAPGTRGMGDHCAPSAAVGMMSSLEGSSVNVNYETPVVRILTRAGYRVVVTDYIGLGSEGTHTYLNRVDQGHALIDAARAVAKPGEKVGFWGYSQGGGAAAAAAELVAEYAPELNVVGTFSGAPPADPIAVLETATAGLIDVVAGFAAASYSATYPEFRDALDEALNDEGRRMLTGLTEACVIDGGRVTTKPFPEYTKDGRTLAQIARSDERIMAVLEHNKLGKVPVSAPIMVMTNPDDDLVPEPQATQLAADYCALGAPAEYRRVRVPGTNSMPLSTRGKGSSALFVSQIPGAGHATPLILQTKNAAAWMDDRFAGKTFEPKCPGSHEELLLEDAASLPTNLNAIEVTAIVLGTLALLVGAVGAAGAAAYHFGLVPPELLQLVPPELLRLLP